MPTKKSGKEVPGKKGKKTIARNRTARHDYEITETFEAGDDVQAAVDGGANIYVEIDAENAGDFLNAVVPMDASGRAVDVPDLAGGGRLLILLVLTE